MAAAATTDIAGREPRPLGIRRKPQLRLALGYRDEQRKGAPVKTDYFIPKGNEAAVAKFKRVYGDQPRAIDIRLPGTLGGFLEIKHLAFAGGNTDTGGVLKAVGRTNFALEGTLGGPDLLTVFNVVDGKLSVDEVEIGGVDDPVCRQLGVQLTTTVAFGIPDVLGFGGVCAITSRGKETTDTLWETAVDIYGNLGPAASMILRPKLILKPSRMLTPGGTHAAVYVLDLYVPESRDEIIEKAREYRELLPAHGRRAAGVLYGPSPGEVAGELPRASSVMFDLNPEDVIDEAPDTSHGTATDGDEVAGQQAGAATAAAASAPDEPLPGEPGDDEEPASLFKPPAGAVPDEVAAAQAAADAAGAEIVTVGKNEGKPISAVSKTWLKWAIKEDGFVHQAAARAYARVHEPETFQAAMAELEAAVQA